MIALGVGGRLVGSTQVPAPGASASRSRAGASLVLLRMPSRDARMLPALGLAALQALGQGTREGQAGDTTPASACEARAAAAEASWAGVKGRDPPIGTVLSHAKAFFADVMQSAVAQAERDGLWARLLHPHLVRPAAAPTTLPAPLRSCFVALSPAALEQLLRSTQTLRFVTSLPSLHEVLSLALPFHEALVAVAESLGRRCRFMQDDAEWHLFALPPSQLATVFVVHVRAVAPSRVHGRGVQEHATDARQHLWLAPSRRLRVRVLVREGTAALHGATKAEAMRLVSHVVQVVMRWAWVVSGSGLEV
mmetsp:Transcript_3933/g.12530  ORF Transcript_3933/g.12530 Transcript_3933/m.12530 type:complete len:307 (+) Transcript_3933:191-1111(+)